MIAFRAGNNTFILTLVSLKAFPALIVALVSHFVQREALFSSSQLISLRAHCCQASEMFTLNVRNNTSSVKIGNLIASLFPVTNMT